MITSSVHAAIANAKTIKEELKSGNEFEKEEYFFKIRHKVTNLLMRLCEKYGISDEVALKENFAILPKKYFIEYYKKSKRINNSYYLRGEELIPETWEDWVKDNFPDYYIAQDIYDNMVRTKKVHKSDLETLNKLYRRL